MSAAALDSITQVLWTVRGRVVEGYVESNNTHRARVLPLGWSQEHTATLGGMRVPELEQSRVTLNSPMQALWTVNIRACEALFRIPSRITSRFRAIRNTIRQSRPDISWP